MPKQTRKWANSVVGVADPYRPSRAIRSPTALRKLSVPPSEGIGFGAKSVTGREKGRIAKTQIIQSEGEQATRVQAYVTAPLLETTATIQFHNVCLNSRQCALSKNLEPFALKSWNINCLCNCRTYRNKNAMDQSVNYRCTLFLKDQKTL